ncbi:unnamed protein product [Sphenostylis stenocarpa]|uniref:Uncharacterized protein n=1 Tax=Sphenostylis stenocarpa TaxID=92480 RepID=A0AA86VEQ1_9FABA|nr:unnamed protein product [Sphenostylis stenocarpa]
MSLAMALSEEAFKGCRVFIIAECVEDDALKEKREINVMSDQRTNKSRKIMDVNEMVMSTCSKNIMKNGANILWDKKAASDTPTS